ncbi:hypothetical protein SAMN05216535_2399 [Stutzerimonas xanthomarina]|uniref:Uncharacterized protein n=2 Tax=Stutzerimonas xanthomarina TaxID=271420 RepID=A0A1M5MQN3_9GAMM|nr:hypothetical protein SAMN05216535_2399 [Stutzerimonas xanthomarina]SHG79382.1 hypothetical protein SAMN02744645_1418 [Stutzerimonas xanthomarina DSM 18231]
MHVLKEVAGGAGLFFVVVPFLAYLVHVGLLGGV